MTSIAVFSRCSQNTFRWVSIVAGDATSECSGWAAGEDWGSAEFLGDSLATGESESELNARQAQGGRVKPKEPAALISLSRLSILGIATPHSFVYPVDALGTRGICSTYRHVIRLTRGPQHPPLVYIILIHSRNSLICTRSFLPAFYHGKHPLIIIRNPPDKRSLACPSVALISSSDLLPSPRSLSPFTITLR